MQRFCTARSITSSTQPTVFSVHQPIGYSIPRRAQMPCCSCVAWDLPRRELAIPTGSTHLHRAATVAAVPRQLHGQVRECPAVTEAAARCTLRDMARAASPLPGIACCAQRVRCKRCRRRSCSAACMRVAHCVIDAADQPGCRVHHSSKHTRRVGDAALRHRSKPTPPLCQFAQAPVGQERRSHRRHICTGTAPPAPHLAPGLGIPWVVGRECCARVRVDARRPVFERAQR